MSLTLKQSQAIRDIAEVLYDFLPASGAKQWSGHVTFETVAQRAGVEDCWSGLGNKTRKIVTLLENVFKHRPQRFERLMIEIVRAGIDKRASRDPVTSREIELLNGYLLTLGVKFPELHDPAFLSSLDLGDVGRATIKLDEERDAAAARDDARAAHRSLLDELRRQFEELSIAVNRQAVGLALEGVLTRLFEGCGLAPREPFRVVGEQIDGSFELDHEVYLVEAKWHKEALSQDVLLVFDGKIRGKSQYTRGVFIALNGVTRDAADAISRGKELRLFVVDGVDLMAVFMGQLALHELLRRRFRLLTEEGKVWIPLSALLARST